MDRCNTQYNVSWQVTSSAPVLVAAVALSCTTQQPPRAEPGPTPECATDADCEANEQCVNGECQVVGEELDFAGAETCRTCHPDVHAEWSETIHAGAWETLKSSDHMQDSCIPCHVVGYQQGGFVDEETTPEFADVQCENCHGAAGDHAANPADASLRPPVDISAEVCGACHTGSHHPNFEQWQESGHAQINEGVAEDFLAGGFYVNVCGICHSGDVHYEAVIGVQEVPDDRFAGLTDEDLTPITCAVCHDPHGQTGNAVKPAEGRDYQLRYSQVADPEPSNAIDDVTNPGRFGICGQCHHSRGRTWQSSDRGPHRSVQANVYLGEMAAPEGDAEPLVPNTTSIHAGLSAQCSTCHMYRKDFESQEAPTISGHLFSVNTEGCTPCHTSEGAQDLVEAIEGETQGRLDAIAARLGDESTWQYSATGGPPEAADAEEGQMSQDDISDDIKQVRFLYSYVASDGSFGAHNPAYVRALLDRAEEILDLAGL